MIYCDKYTAIDHGEGKCLFGRLQQIIKKNMSPESYEKIWKGNFPLSGIHSLV